jgi:hypothetical protein
LLWLVAIEEVLRGFEPGGRKWLFAVSIMVIPNREEKLNHAVY